MFALKYPFYRVQLAKMIGSFLYKKKKNRQAGDANALNLTRSDLLHLQMGL